MKRSLLAILLAASNLLLVANFAGAETPQPGVNTADSSSNRGPAQDKMEAVYESLMWHPVQLRFASELQQMSQVWVATYCYTYAGPVCPMRVAVPVGTPCACYDAYGNSLAGVAN